MKLLILNERQREVIAKVNAVTPDRQLAPVPLADGRWALNADVLDDPGVWGRHLAALGGCEVAEWRAAGGKLEPARTADKRAVAAATERLAAEWKPAAAELDAQKDFLVAPEGATKEQEAAVQAEIAARYAAERARIAALVSAGTVEVAATKE